ncbi:hypothetical protein CEXT_313391 [Caerostris extrusa]|uniref:Uncharacterized protein n=1 Tax=Caerostris extrusa TaxID=172846 RepID=A0AAV4Y943_CAEEX|nr:hypothetical protein CEXT_313391 [Caerostris extrusa]
MVELSQKTMRENVLFAFYGVRRKNWLETKRCEKESFETPKAGVEKETLLMTSVDQEGHISFVKESRSEQKRSLMRRGSARSGPPTTPRKDLPEANSTYGN